MDWEKIVNTFLGIFTGFSPIYLVETFLFFLLIYCVFKVLKNKIINFIFILIYLI